MKRVLLALVGSITFLLIGSIGSSDAYARQNQEQEHESKPLCQEVKARIVSSFSSAECASPIHLCTVGTITGDGLFNGSSDYTAEALGPIAADLNGRTAYSYNGNLVLTTRHGQLMVSDLGVLDETGFSFSELSLSLSGTGKFQGATGHIFFFGSVSQTGFIGDMRGTLCTPSRLFDLD